MLIFKLIHGALRFLLIAVVEGELALVPWGLDLLRLMVLRKVIVDFRRDRQNSFFAVTSVALI